MLGSVLDEDEALNCGSLEECTRSESRLIDTGVRYCWLVILGSRVKETGRRVLSTHVVSTTRTR